MEDLDNRVDATGPPTAAEAFEVFFARVLPRALAGGMSLLGNRMAAEDVATDALARAYVRWQELSQLPYRDAWVLRVTANLAYDELRRQARQHGLGSEQVAGGEYADAELRAILLPALQRLSQRQREVVVLGDMIGLPQAEIADVLGCSRNSVKVYAHRRRARLRRDIERSGLEMERGPR